MVIMKHLTVKWFYLVHAHGCCFLSQSPVVPLLALPILDFSQAQALLLEGLVLYINRKEDTNMHMY